MEVRLPRSGFLCEVGSFSSHPLPRVLMPSKSPHEGRFRMQDVRAHSRVCRVLALRGLGMGGLGV